MKSSIIIATSSNILNKKFHQLLERTKQYDVLKVCTEQDEAEKFLLSHKPHLAILSGEYKTGSGIPIAGKLKRKGITTKVALLCESEDVTLMRLALEYGVRSYFKYVHEGQLFECLNALHKNEFYIETELYHAHYFSKVG